ncbi:hypothetical protein CTAYLR_003040 [Chrysophaeum taylorii]|uniref:Pyruvate kinase n=1 Tax=Chrysophaeum taylorii TaxID=2483200 RepID=A0AAD7XJP3_9STRA|nr:hypothetical protein CTAYLR_003040 [Chrysophaeum taylorii]
MLLRTAASSLASLARRALSSSSSSLPMTKIVCTLGPASESSEIVHTLVSEGLVVARLNFSHVGSSYDEPQAKLEVVRGAPGIHALLDDGVAEKRRPANLRAVMVDTKGPEIRTRPLPGGAPIAEIVAGAEIRLTHEDVTEKKSGEWLGHDYELMAQTVRLGSQVLLDDGLVALEVTGVEGSVVVTRALNSGPIKANKGVNLPGCALQLPALTAKDRQDLEWAVASGADAVAASFIRNAANVRAVVAHLERCCGQVGRKTRPLVISKIESQEGVENFDGILEASDGVMIARGDLGVEIPFELVFKAQKEMVAACNRAGKPVIVATQMIDSMQKNPRPTRAEVTDVGNAVLDGADAVMLSGETAVGKYPVEAVRAMAKIVREADALVDRSSSFRSSRPRVSLDDASLGAVASAAVETADAVDAAIIICITHTGSVAKAIAKMRPSVPVVALCGDERVARQLQFHRGLQPILFPTPSEGGDAYHSKLMSDLRAEALRTCTELGWISSGDRVVVVDRKQGTSTDKHHNRVNLLVITVA